MEGPARALALTLFAALFTPAAALGRPGAEGRALLATGRYAEARRVLEGEVARDPRALEARYQLGLVYRAIGAQAEASRVWNGFYDDYEAGRIDKRSARQLTYVAQAARYLGSWQDAIDTIGDAIDADPLGHDGARAHVVEAEMQLEKYQAGYAEVALHKALGVLPDDPDAHALMARVLLEQSYDVDGAERELARALAKDPHHEEALCTRAQLLLEAERYAEATAAARAVLELDPESVRARAVIAAAALLRDDACGLVAST
jgi:tetratricopeptide (TPR) repeat protein